MPSSTEQRTRLDSGLVIVTESIPTVRSVTVGAWVTRGSRDEPEALNGVTHFLEHMLFKGTQRRSARDIAVAIDAMGGQLDAFTSRENACYYAVVLDEHLPDALELLADLLLHPRFDPGDIERERGVILEEIAAAEDDAEDLLFETFLADFWAGHPMGRSILGTRESVSSFTAAMLRERLQQVGPADVVIAAAGNLQHERIVELVATAFEGLVGTSAWPAHVAPLPHAHAVLLGRGDLEQVQLYLAGSAPDSGSEARYAGEVLNTLLGGSVSSRLFQVIREDRGLAYNVYSSVSGYSDAGHVYISAGTREAAVPEVLELIAGELKQLRSEPLPAEELARTKEHLKGALMLGLENTFGRMAKLARQHIEFGHSYGLDEILAGIERVEAVDVQRLAAELFAPGALSCGLIGRQDTVERLQRRWSVGLSLPGGIEMRPQVRSRPQ